MKDVDLLRHMGTDGAKWAAEFRKSAIKLGYSEMDEGWLIGWFANAIEAGRSVSRGRPSWIDGFAAAAYLMAGHRDRYERERDAWRCSHDRHR